jgi:hypothetical protein
LKDWTKPLRKAYYDALNGQVVIDSAPVPVFQDKVPDDVPSDLYIVVADTLSSDASPFNVWVRDALMNIEVVAMSQAEPGDYVDDMVDQIKQKLFLTRTTFGIAQPAGFQVTKLTLDAEQDIPVMQTATGYIKRKILRTRQTIVDNN